MITFFAIMFITVYFFVNKEVTKKRTIAFLALIVFFIASATILIERPMFGCEQVAVITTTNNFDRSEYTIYHDADENSYFCTDIHWWNPLKLNHRVPVNTEKMEHYLEIQKKYEEELSQINIFE